MKLSLAPLFWTQAALVLANVEKTIFLGPAAVNIPLAHPTLDDLNLEVLTPASPPTSSSLRTRLEAQFPTASHPCGKSTWLLLDNLEPGRRYEVRICWAATQPTSFDLSTHELDTVFATPELITSLWEYTTPPSSSSDQKPRIHTPSRHQQQSTSSREASTLLLQISAAADYFSPNATLMQSVPPVDVDIILDAFVLNVLPRSLVPTVGYIVVVAVLSFFVARQIVAWFRAVIDDDDDDDDDDNKNTQTKKKQ
ncbi:hypothetical protein B0H63DRAFT_151891 [Podospora didyma]|uniref:Uncharacterized protein n=1 Tax=Podospora didyma TaxID=330526 RepID=A0AAE0NTG2_9PEZI|nr:hypothetical protein B0H63DRAFT_151891 [Podospora didyma]